MVLICGVILYTLVLERPIDGSVNTSGYNLLSDLKFVKHQVMNAILRYEDSSLLVPTSFTVNTGKVTQGVRRGRKMRMV